MKLRAVVLVAVVTGFMVILLILVLATVREPKIRDIPLSALEKPGIILSPDIPLDLDEQARIRRAFEDVPLFPGASLMKVSYQPGRVTFGNAPDVFLKFSLPKADKRYCEIVSFFDQELSDPDWSKSESNLPGLPWRASGCGSHHYYKSSGSSRTIFVESSSFDADTFTVREESYHE